MSKKPFIWLASYPKSGNTWIRIFLGCYLNDGPVDINSLPLDLTHYDLHKHFYRAVSPKGIPDSSHFEITNLRGAVLQHMYSCSPGWPVLIKTHHARVRMYGVDLIPNVLTERAVYLVRDPRDVAVSYANHTGQDIDTTIEMMADKGAGSSHKGEPALFHFLSTWSNHVNSWMSAQEYSVLCLRYEDLHSNPEEQFSELIKFLGWEVDEDRVRRALGYSRFSNLQSQEEAAGFKELQNGQTFFRRGEAGSWKETLTELQVREIEKVHGEVMNKLGYELYYES